LQTPRQIKTKQISKLLLSSTLDYLLFCSDHNKKFFVRTSAKSPNSRGGSRRDHFAVTPPAPRSASTRYVTHLYGLRYPPSSACQRLSMNELVISKKGMPEKSLIRPARVWRCDNRVKKPKIGLARQGAYVVVRSHDHGFKTTLKTNRVCMPRPTASISNISGNSRNHRWIVP
jgi:hypothetical protein